MNKPFIKYGAPILVVACITILSWLWISPPSGSRDINLPNICPRNELAEGYEVRGGVVPELDHSNKLKEKPDIQVIFTVFDGGHDVKIHPSLAAGAVGLRLFEGIRSDQG